MEKITGTLETVEPQIFIFVKQVIDKYDVEGLLRVGCPGDEYDPISKVIAERWVSEGGNSLDETRVAHIIAFAFHSAFRDWSHPIHLHAVDFEQARELMSILPEVEVGFSGEAAPQPSSDLH
jgi:hypothetical protein